MAHNNLKHNLTYPVNALFCIIFIQILSHYSHSPLWLIIYVAGIACYGFIVQKFTHFQVSGVVRFILVCLSIGFFVLYYKTNFSVDMAASFLLLASILKLLELRNNKDIALFVYVMLYLSAISFLFSQGLIHTLVQLAAIFFSLYVLLYLNGGQNFKLYQAPWASLLKVLAMAVPMVLICFLFFPRIAPLWNIPVKTQHATTGMSDFMSPGNISELAQSSERAFRASFSQSIPAQQDLYWRGLVLDFFDGRTWRSRQADSNFARSNKIDNGVLYDHGADFYEVMLEPTNQSWVFALESSRISSSNVTSKDMGVFALKTDAIQPTRYKMTFKERNVVRLEKPSSATRLSGKARVLASYQADLQAPKNTNQRTQRYVKDLQHRYPDNADLVDFLMQEFRRKDYFYTLKPPLTGENFVDEFLFDTRQGFCAHYAGSLAYMLRLAGIPARVIIGYQGGEFNKNGNYLIVHQYDAHAWVEAYLPREGWLRLDPTAMVAPERVLSNLNAAVGQQGEFLADSPFASAALNIGMLSWARLRLDELNYQWQKLVVNYNNDEQQSLIKKMLGKRFSDLGGIMGTAIVFGTVFLGFIAALMIYLSLMRFSGHYSKAEKHYMIWVYLLGRLVNLKRGVGETPKAFLHRVQSSPHHRLARITEKYTLKLEQEWYQNK